MEKDSMNENEIRSEVEETKIQASKIKMNEVETSTTKQDVEEENINVEVSELISDEQNDENIKENSSAKFISANIVDQLLILASSGMLLSLCDLILRIFGYMFVRETGALILAGGIIYFILNCIYAPIIEKSKLKNTIGKNILKI